MGSQRDTRPTLQQARRRTAPAPYVPPGNHDDQLIVRHGEVASSRSPVTRQGPDFFQSTWEPKLCARRDQAVQGHPGNRAARETCPGHPVRVRSPKARALQESQSTSAVAGAIRPAPPWPGKSGPDTSTHYCNSHCDNQHRLITQVGRRRTAQAPYVPLGSQPCSSAVCA